MKDSISENTDSTKIDPLSDEAFWEAAPKLTTRLQAWQEAARRNLSVIKALQQTIHNDTVDLCELHQQVGDLFADNKRLREFIQREVMHPLAASPRLRKLALEALEGK